MTAGKETAAKLPNKNRWERQYAMKHFLVATFAITTSFALFAQTTPRPAAHNPGRPAGGAAVKLPPGVPPGHGIVKTAFSLRYQDLRIGTGADAEPNKTYKVQYTGWLAADGHKFASSYDH